MSPSPKPPNPVARRGFLIEAGLAGTGAALGAGLALAGGSGRALAATVPSRSALMTAALGTPLDDLPDAIREAREAGPRLAGQAARAAGVARALTPFLDPLPVPRVLRGRKGELTVTMRSARVRLHRSLPFTRLWTYEGTHLPRPRGRATSAGSPSNRSFQ